MVDGVPTARRRVRFWGALGVLVVLGALTGLVVSAFSRPVYSATSTSFVSTQAATSVSDLQQPGDLAHQVQHTYASLATTPTVLRPVIATLRLRTTAEELANRIEATDSADTALLQITVSDASATEAAAVANAVAAELSTQVGALKPPGRDVGSVRLTVVRSAAAPERPSSPSVSVDLLLGALSGGVLWSVVFVGPVVVRALRSRGTGGIAAPSMF